MSADPLLKLLSRSLFGVAGRLLPFGWCRHIARPIGGAAWMVGLRRSVIETNLAHALPGLSLRERRRIGREALINVFTVGLELLVLRYLSIARLRRSLLIENIELLHSLDERGALLLSGHVGNWELLAFGAAALSGVPFSIVVKEQNDYGELNRTRIARGNRTIPAGRAAREAASLLARSGVIAMLADQSATSRDASTTMFDLPTFTFSAPARLALRFRPRVITGFALRDTSGVYHVRLEELPYDDLSDTSDDIDIFTQRYVDRLEAAVRSAPEQWLWGHRRWKYTEGVVYGD